MLSAFMHAAAEDEGASENSDFLLYVTAVIIQMPKKFLDLEKPAPRFTRKYVH